MVVVEPKYVVRTERLLLRPLTIEDAEDVLHMRRDAEVMLHTSLQPSSDISQTIAWIEGCFRSSINWNFAIELLSGSTTSSHATSPVSTRSFSDTATIHSGPRVIGLIGAVRAPEIGYMFNRCYWGHGFATEALQAFMPLFFDHFSGQKTERFEYAEALTDTELISSQNVLTKVGFELAERRENDFENPVLGTRSTFVYRRYRPSLETRGP